MRNQTFFSLAENNAAIAQALDRINDHVVRRLSVTRRQLFENVERAALARLPGDDYVFAEWRLVRVSTDYHVEYRTFLFSVPHSLIRQQVDLRATARTVEIFHRGKLVAAHQRRYGGPRHGTDSKHTPSSHRRYAEWRPIVFAAGAHRLGPIPKVWSSRFSPAGRARNRAFEHAWVSCACFATSLANAPRTYQPELSGSEA